MALSYYQVKCINTFKQKNLTKNGFLRSSHWSKRITYITNNKLSPYETRKLFHSLVKKGYFFKKKLPTNSYLYEFKKNKKDERPYIDDSMFIVDFA